MTKQYKNYVGGEWKLSKEGIEICVPAIGEELGSVPAMSQEEVDYVYASAKAARKEWRAFSYVEHATYLRRTADISVRNAEKVGAVLSEEAVKGYKSVVGEVIRTARVINYTAKESVCPEGKALGGGNFEAASKKRTAAVRHEPVGLVLAILPSNHPINLTGSKVAPTLISGNVVALKPPTQGSISGPFLAEVFAGAGFPVDVFNTTTGHGSVIGDYVVEYEAVNCINFTGSMPVGEYIGELAGMRPIMLELGGKDSTIVLENADLDLAAKSIVAGAYSYSDQYCTAVKHVLVMGSIADKLIAKVLELARDSTVGIPEDDADITLLIDTKAADYVGGLIEDAQNKGAKEIISFKREGNLIGPVLFDSVITDIRLAWEEPLGLAPSVICVNSVEEAVETSDKSEYGLQAAVFTNNFPLASRITGQPEVGTVHINNKTQRGTDDFPFLGAKGSSARTQGVKCSIETMTTVKSTVSDIAK